MPYGLWLRVATHMLLWCMNGPCVCVQLVRMSSNEGQTSSAAALSPVPTWVPLHSKYNTYMRTQSISGMLSMTPGDRRKEHDERKPEM